MTIIQRVRAASLVIVALAGLTTSGCGRDVHLGAISGDGGDSGDGSGTDILWSATFEVGDLSEWMGDGHGGTYVANAAAAPIATTDTVHRGRYAGMATVTPTAMMSIDYLFRNLPSPAEAYYSAWYYVPASFTVKNWLSLMHFNGSVTGDGNNLFALWDLNLYPRPDGSLVAHLYDYLTFTNLEQVVPVAVPTAAWVHFEIFLRKAATATGEIAVWQDGVEILDTRNIVTATTDWVQWEAGGASDAVTPAMAVVYFDDAAISLSRLGTAPWATR